MLYYSYQYNLKIVGVPLISESESAQDTAELCVKLFSGLGVDVSISEIDIAHRVPQRDTSTGNGNRRQPNPIICKFTRSMTRDTVLASRGNASRLTTEDLDLPSLLKLIGLQFTATSRRDYKSCYIQRRRTKTHTTTSGAGQKAQQSSYGFFYDDSSEVD